MENQPPQNPTPNQPQSPANPIQPAQVPTARDPQTTITGGKKKFPLKIILAVVIFLLLAGGAAAGYVYREPLLSMISKPTPTPAPIVTVTPTPDPTADWKSYENTQFGYSIKYSDEQNSLAEYDSVKAQVPVDEERYWTTAISLCKPSECELAPANLGIHIYENPNKLSFDEWLLQSKKRPMSFGTLNECLTADPRTKISDSLFMGLDSKTYEYTIDTKTVQLMQDGKCSKTPLEGGGSFRYITFEKGNNIFSLSMHYYNESEWQRLEQILSTFKFTD